MQNKGDEGFALIGVLAFMLMMSVIVFGIMQYALISTNAFQREYRQVKFLYLAEAAVENLHYDVWKGSALSAYLIGEYQQVLLGTSITLHIENEDERLNINRANESQLIDFFESKKFDKFEAQNLAARILDWRDKDNLKRLNGAETLDYKLETAPRNGFFETLGEIQLITDKMIPQDVLNALTIYTFTEGKINNFRKKTSASVSSFQTHLRIKISDMTAPYQQEKTFVYRGNIKEQATLKRLR